MSYRPDNAEAGFSEGGDRSGIGRRRISDDRADVVADENVRRCEVADDHRTEPPARHLDLSYRQVHSGRTGVSAEPLCVLRKVAPPIPLNEADRGTSVLDHIKVHWFTPIDTRSVLRFNSGHFKALIPPDRDVRRRKPFLQPCEV